MKKKNQVLYKKKQVTEFSKSIWEKILHNFIWGQIYFAVILCDLHSELIQFDSLREIESTYFKPYLLIVFEEYGRKLNHINIWFQRCIL